MTPATVDLAALGATVQLSAEVRDQNGQAMAGAAVTWASGTAAVATVSAFGLVTAVANGTGAITATSGSASGSATVTVAQEVSAIAVVPDAATVVEGDTLRLAATATDANGQAVTGVEIVWASGDTAVAVVDAAGLVTGVGDGQAEVTATTAGITGGAQLTVVAPAPTAIAVTPNTALLTALGQTAQFLAEVRDQIGRVMENRSVVWASSDSMVATVDSTGLVTATANGTAAITATAGSASDTAVVTVKQSVRSATVSPAADTIALGDTLWLVAEGYDKNGRVVEGVAFTWSSSNVAVATVDPSGLVRGAAEGTATIAATAGDASGTSDITVANRAPEPAGTIPEQVVRVGDDPVILDVAPYFTDPDGDSLTYSASSGDPEVAMVSVSASTLTITAAKPGQIDVSVSARDPQGATATQHVSVTVAGFTLSGTVSDSRSSELLLAGAVVALGNGRIETVATDADGRYRFLNVAGPISVTVTAEPSYVSQTLDVTMDVDRTVDFVLDHTGVPPFGGTVWITPDILDASDPTSLSSVTYVGRGPREYWDGQRWITINAYLFDVRYAGPEMEFQVHPELGGRASARREVDTYASALGRLPAVFLSQVAEVEIGASNSGFAGNVAGILHVHTGDGEKLIDFVEEIFLHEAAHASLDATHANTAAWRAAQEADGVFISDYARDHPDREDIAESILPYFAVRYRPERLTETDRAAILAAIPNRLAYFDEQGFDMSPYTVRGSVLAR